MVTAQARHQDHEVTRPEAGCLAKHPELVDPERIDALKSPSVEDALELRRSLARAEAVHVKDHSGRAQAYRFLAPRSEEHTSELQSLMRISYAVFCLTHKKAYTYTHL